MTKIVASKPRTNESFLNSFGVFHSFLIFIYFLISSNGDLVVINHMPWILFSIAAVGIFFRAIQNRLIINRYSIWFSIFVIFTIASYFWSINKEFSIMGIKVIIFAYPLSIYLSSLIKTKEDLMKVIRIFLLTTFITILTVILKTDFSNSSILRLTSGYGGNWNPNIFGMQVSFVFCLLFVEKYENAKSSKSSILRIMYGVLCLAVVLLTGSKKALFIIIVFLLSYYNFSLKSSRAKKIIVITSIMVLTYYLIYNVPFFYKAIGLRIDQFVNSLGNISTGERGGDLGRLAMIEFGWKKFLEKPLLGYGAWNYAYLSGISSSSYVYSHNNYIEMLVNFGVIGTSVYYYSYFYVVKKSLKYKLNNLVLSLLLTLIITDIAFVSYYTYYYQLIIIVLFSLIRFNTGNKLGERV